MKNKLASNFAQCLLIISLKTCVQSKIIMRNEYYKLAVVLLNSYGKNMLDPFFMKTKSKDGLA